MQRVARSIVPSNTSEGFDEIEAVVSANADSTIPAPRRRRGGRGVEKAEGAEGPKLGLSLKEQYNEE